MESLFKITDYTSNGKCSRCGGCCSGVLPMTDSELATIKKYVEEHHIRPVDYASVLIAKPLDTTCPFCAENKCTIYDIRPKICHNFICSMSTEAALKQKQEFYSDPRYKQRFLRDELFGQKTALLLMTLMREAL